MKRLYFMRHGLSVLNVKGIRAGHIETPLTDEGRLQAKKAGMSAKAHNIDTIACSPLSRAHETAKIVARELGFNEDHIHISSLLIERNFGSLDGQPYDPDVNLDGISDAESFDELRKRAQLALEWIETLGGTNVLVVSHGALGRAMRNIHQPDTDFNLRLQNAEIERWL